MFGETPERRATGAAADGKAEAHRMRSLPGNQGMGCYSGTLIGPWLA